MSRPPPSARFAARPGDAERWVKAPEPTPALASPYTARLTIDVTPALRRRLKRAALERGLTVAVMLRALMEREFPEAGEEAP